LAPLPDLPLVADLDNQLLHEPFFLISTDLKNDGLDNQIKESELKKAEEVRRPRLVE